MSEFGEGYRPPTIEDKVERLEHTKLPDVTPGLNDGISPTPPPAASTPQDNPKVQDTPPPAETPSQRRLGQMGMSSMQGMSDAVDTDPALPEDAPTNDVGFQKSDSPADTPAAISVQNDGDTAQTQLAVDSLSQMPDIQPEAWENLNNDERLTALQNVESTMANIQGRPAVDVISTQAGPGEFGAYAPNTNQISVGSYSLENEPVQENVDTIVHEGRHAYQQHAVDNPGFHANDAEVESWRENMLPGNYLTAQEYGQEIYQSQPIEADAWQYGSTIANGVYGENE